MRVLELAVSHNVKFICLPCNATQYAQPLDVAVYRPMKIYWREILNNWKETSEGKKFGTLPKELFPTLLTRLVKKLTPTVEQNLISGFRSSGIYPVDVEELLKKFVHYQNV